MYESGPVFNARRIEVSSQITPATKLGYISDKPKKCMAQQKAGLPNLAAAVILVVLGAFYMLAPHSIHVSSGFGLGLTHTIHNILGVVLLAIGAAYYAKQTGTPKKK